MKSSYVYENEASGRAQAAAGYKIVGRRREEVFINGHWHDMILTEVMRDEWEKENSV